MEKISLNCGVCWKLNIFVFSEERILKIVILLICGNGEGGEIGVLDWFILKWFIFELNIVK